MDQAQDRAAMAPAQAGSMAAGAMAPGLVAAGPAAPAPAAAAAGAAGPATAGGTAAPGVAGRADPAGEPRQQARRHDLRDPETQRMMQARRAAINAERRARGLPGLGTEARRAAAERRRAEEAKAFARARARRAAIGKAWTAARRLAFLEALAETGNATRAAERAGCHVETARRLADRDPAFAAAWVDAMRAWRDSLDGALREAAIRAYGTLAANGGFGKRPAVSERLALWLAQGMAPGGKAPVEPRAAPHLSGIDGEAEEEELERLLEELARKMGSPFAPAEAAGAMAGEDGTGGAGMADQPEGGGGPVGREAGSAAATAAGGR